MRIILLLFGLSGAIAGLLYFVSTPNPTFDVHDDAHEDSAAVGALEHEHLYTDVVQSFNADPESPIVCYRKNHRNFYVIIFFLSFVLLLLTTFFLFRFRRLSALVRKKNSELEHVYGELNSSIDYASNLHKVVLPFDKMKELLPTSFVVNEPCQKIGGDFFWISQHGNVLVLGIVDCTGHGVPGALISMVSFDLMKKIINEENCENPALILTELNSAFIAAFDPIRNKLHDGLDLSLVCVNTKEERIVFSGAGNGISYTNGRDWFEQKGIRQGIGGYVEVRSPEFVNHELKYDETMSYYLFSDGFPDQFGGKDNKKLGRKRVREQLMSMDHLAIETRGSSLQSFLNEWRGRFEQNDDITIIGFKI